MTSLTIAEVRNFLTSHPSSSTLLTQRLRGRWLHFVCGCGSTFSITFTALQNRPFPMCPKCWTSHSSRPPRRNTEDNTQLRNWSRQVIARDQRCILTARRASLVAHHLNNYKEFPAQRYLLSNGVSLWRPLHEEFHRIYGPATTRQQFTTFYQSYLALQMESH